MWFDNSTALAINTWQINNMGWNICCTHDGYSCHDIWCWHDKYEHGSLASINARVLLGGGNGVNIVIFLHRGYVNTDNGELRKRIHLLIQYPHCIRNGYHVPNCISQMWLCISNITILVILSEIIVVIIVTAID